MGRSPIKWRQRPVMTIAVDCYLKHQFKKKKQKKKQKKKKKKNKKDDDIGFSVFNSGQTTD